MNPEKVRKRTTSPRKDALTAYNTIMPELAVVLKNKQKKSRKKQKRHVFVASGIYRHTREGTYHERPKINGKRTWRSLGVSFTPQRNFKAAEDEWLAAGMSAMFGLQSSKQFAGAHCLRRSA